MSVALFCLLLFTLQISAGSGRVLLLSRDDEIPSGWMSPDDLLTKSNRPVGDLFWTAEDGILVISRLKYF